MSTRFIPRFVTAVLLLPLLVAPLGAQSTTVARRVTSMPQASPLFATRADLMAKLAAAERAAAEAAGEAQRRPHLAEARRIQERLRDGDLQPGDRVALSLTGELAVRDTLVVSAARTIAVPSLPELSVAGVLRSEVQQHVVTSLARFIKDPDVRATPLVRIVVLGQVARPGFYAVPADILVGDVIMHAGGPTSDADIASVSIRRSGQELWNAVALRVAVAQGHTLDRLDIRAGDEVVVARRRQVNWMQVFQILGTVGALAGLVASLGN
jgi:protein involved in polysaccharide export with SLBB domain